MKLLVNLASHEVSLKALRLMESDMTADDHTKLEKENEKFLSDVLNTWPKQQEVFFSHLDSMESEREKIFALSRMLRRSIRKRQEPFFTTCFRKSMEYLTVPNYCKFSLHQAAVEEENRNALELLAQYNFLPPDHEFISRVVRGDQTIFDGLKVLESSSRESKKELAAKFFSGDKWTEKKCAQVIKISLNLRHRPANLALLKKFMTFSSLTKQVNFPGRVCDGHWNADNKTISKCKFFIEHGKPAEKLGQVFIDSATDHRLLWLRDQTMNIENLLFLIRHGGTKIDQICAGFDNFFRLLVRGVRFETEHQQLLGEVQIYFDELTGLLMDPNILPVTSLVHIVLLHL